MVPFMGDGRNAQNKSAALADRAFVVSGRRD